MGLFELCEKGNHFYNLGEYDRALYYYELAINKGYDGLQIIQRAQRLKDQGIISKPPIHVGKARRVVRTIQEPHKQYIFVKANYPDRLIKSLETLIQCTQSPRDYKIQKDEQKIQFLHGNDVLMIFPYRDKKNLHVIGQYFTEIEKYYKIQKMDDGRKIKLPSKRRKFHFVIVHDSFVDLLVELKKIKLLEETYYEDHRNDLIAMIDKEFGNYKYFEIQTLSLQFVYWLETHSVLFWLFREHTDLLEIDYLKNFIMENIDYYLKIVEREAIFKIDYYFMILVFLERLYKRFPAEQREKYEFIYEKYYICRRFSDTFKQFFDDIEKDLINEPKLHGFYKFIPKFRENLFK
ncbi:MAG: hypothetical protein ACTSWN_13000 [Promethearchaeota archaeon]